MYIELRHSLFPKTVSDVEQVIAGERKRRREDRTDKQTERDGERLKKVNKRDTKGDNKQHEPFKRDREIAWESGCVRQRH